MPGEEEDRDRMNRAQKVVRALLSGREARQVFVERRVNVRQQEERPPHEQDHFGRRR